MYKKSIKKIFVGILFIIFICLGTAFLYFRAVKISEINTEKNKKHLEITSAVSRFVEQNNFVSSEMMNVDYWVGECGKTENGASDIIMTLEEIEGFNYKNRRMIVSNNIEIALEEIGTTFNGEYTKHLLEDTKAIPSKPEEYFLEGEPTTEAYWEALYERVGTERVPRSFDTRFGYAIARTTLKKFPTDDAVYAGDDSLYYNYMVQSDLLYNMPVAVIHETEDGEWFYVLTYGYGGWVQQDAIALCESREDWLERQNPKDYIVVTAKEIRISTDPYHKELSDIILPMGTVVEVVPFEEVLEADSSIHDRAVYGNYIAKMPYRTDEGNIADKLVLIPATDDVSFGFLPYTQENVLIQAFKLLGTEYGWAGDFNSEDCSGLTREIFSCFGFTLPRSAIAQSEVSYVKTHSVAGKSVSTKLAILENVPVGSLLYFPGHTMLYVGSVNGEPYCISAVGSFATKDMEVGKSVPVNTVVLTNMEDTTRKTGKSWIESVERITVLDK